MQKRNLLAAILLFVSTALFAQDKIRISGNVQDDKKQPVIGANVVLKGTNIGTITDDAGNYSLEVPKETGTLVISYVGMTEQYFPIKINEGNYVLNVDLVSSDVSLNQVVVSASKKNEKILDAPASISVLGQDKIERNVVTTPVEQLKTTPGVDILRTGLISSNVVVRGFNNIFSGSVLNVVDNRIGSVPSLRVNAYQLVPTSNLDFDKIEVVRGPASALYGPNASSGVVHIMTKSPLDQQKKFETTIAMTSGFTVLDNKEKDQFGKTVSDYNGGTVSGNIINPEFRHSGKLFDGKFGYKISGSYFQGQDYPNFDSREPYDSKYHPNPDVAYDGDSLLFGSVANGQIFKPDTLSYQIDANGKIIDSTLKLDVRRFRKDFFLRKYNADARIDIRPIKDITLTINGGLSGTHNVELTGLGAAQGGGVGRGWIYWYLQARFKWKNLFIQYFINSSDAGNTFLIPQLSSSARADYSSESPPIPYQVQLLIDKSKMHVWQIQHSINPIDKLGIIYGADVLWTIPNTQGTINGRFENIDNVVQAGGYVQADYEPLKWMKIVAAFRVDYNSILKASGTSFSPRAAVVFKPAVGHNLRITYNRAFDAPTTLNQFLDLSNGLIPNNINVRGIGNPYGWKYNYDENSNVVQFKSAPWGGTGNWYTFQNHAPNAQMFDSLKNYLVQTFYKKSGDYGQALSLVDAVFTNISGATGTVANATQMSVEYANFAQTKDLKGSIQNVANFKDLKKINNSNTQTLEIGYKGLVAGKLSLQIDGYWTRISNYVSSLKSASGAVILDHESYLGKQYSDGSLDTSGALYKNLYNPDGTRTVLHNLFLGAGLDGSSSLQNDSIVHHIDGSVWDELVVLTYQFPMGTITPTDDKYINSDYILTYQNLGRLDVFGIDFGFQYNAYDDNRHLVQVGGSMSWVDKDQLVLSTGEKVSLNAPKLKAAVTFDHTSKKTGIGYGLTFRYQMGYEANSAIYVGTVKPAYILDARICYRPPFYKGLLLCINVNNVPNYQWNSFPGAPKMGTQFYARAQVTF